MELTGPIPRLEPKLDQVAVTQQTTGIPTAMIDERYVSQFKDKGWTPDTLNADVVLTSTFDDEDTELWFPDREVDIAVNYGAAGIVPCDVPVYDTDSQAVRVETIRTYRETLADIIPRLRDHGIEVIPLVKGVTPYERDICYELFDHYGITRVAYYCGQYFSYGYRFQELVPRLQEIALEYEPDNILAIALQSENLLPQVPPEVTGAAGQRWLSVTDMGSASTAVVVRQYARWAGEVRAALQIGQQPLDAYFRVRGLA